MEDNRRADKTDFEENNRKERVTAQQREKQAKKRAEERDDVAESKSTALQSSTMEIMSQMVTFKLEVARRNIECQEQMEEKDVQEKLT